MVFSLRKKNKREKGFTLIELLVVISIISLLSSIVLVSLGTARDKAKFAALRSTFSTMRTEFEIVYSEGSGYDLHGDYLNSACFSFIEDGSTGEGFTRSLNSVMELVGLDIADEELDDCAVSVSGRGYTIALSLRNLNPYEISDVFCMGSFGTFEVIGGSAPSDFTSPRPGVPDPSGECET